MDDLTKEQRMKNMQSIKSKDTRIEILVRKRLFARGFRFRKNDRRYPGTPDIVLPKFKTVIFINGCFWHGHTECKYFILPKSNKEYWLTKINRNIQRDQKNILELRQKGWNVIVIWECDLKPQNIDLTMEKLIQSVINSEKFNDKLIKVEE